MSSFSSCYSEYESSNEGPIRYVKTDEQVDFMSFFNVLKRKNTTINYLTEKSNAFHAQNSERLLEEAMKAYNERLAKLDDPNLDETERVKIMKEKEEREKHDQQLEIIKSETSARLASPDTIKIETGHSVERLFVHGSSLFLGGHLHPTLYTTGSHGASILVDKIGIRRIGILAHEKNSYGKWYDKSLEMREYDEFTLTYETITINVQVNKFVIFSAEVEVRGSEITYIDVALPGASLIKFAPFEITIRTDLIAPNQKVASNTYSVDIYSIPLHSLSLCKALEISDEDKVTHVELINDTSDANILNVPENLNFQCTSGEVVQLKWGQLWKVDNVLPFGA